MHGPGTFSRIMSRLPRNMMPLLCVSDAASCAAHCVSGRKPMGVDSATMCRLDDQNSIVMVVLGQIYDVANDSDWRLYPPGLRRNDAGTRR